MEPVWSNTFHFKSQNSLRKKKAIDSLLQNKKETFEKTPL